MSKLIFFFFNPTAVAVSRGRCPHRPQQQTQSDKLKCNQRNLSILFIHIVFILLLFSSNCCEAQSLVQLAPPYVQYNSVFFKNETHVEIKFAQAGTQIHYTLNNQPPTEQDKIYTGPIPITGTITTVKAIATGNDFLTSEIVSATFIKDGLKIKSVQQTPANERFPGTGANTLIDNEGGIKDLNSKTWLGYRQDTVEINILTDGKSTISSVLIDCLQDHGGWVFLPQQVKVFYFDDSKASFEFMAGQAFSPNKIVSGASCQPIMMAASKKVATEKIKIILIGIKSLPDNHPGKGQHGWIFIDEIKLY